MSAVQIRTAPRISASTIAIGLQGTEDFGITTGCPAVALSYSRLPLFANTRPRSNEEVFRHICSVEGSEGGRHDTHKSCGSHRRLCFCRRGAAGEGRFPRRKCRNAQARRRLVDPQARRPWLPLFLRLRPAQRFRLRARVPPPLAHALPPGPLRSGERLWPRTVRRPMPPPPPAMRRKRPARHRLQPLGSPLPMFSARDRP